MPRESFWSDHNVEPKRAYRFILLIDGLPQWIIKDVTKPKFDIEVTEHKYLNHTFKFPATQKFEDITVTLVDPVAPDASHRLMTALFDSGYRYPENRDVRMTLSKSRAVHALGNVAIQQIGADGETIEEWTLVNGWIKSVDFGKLAYAENEMVNISLTIAYDYPRMVPDVTPTF